MATACRPAERISWNGCNCAGRGWPKSRSHASLPIPRMHDRLGEAARNPTALTKEDRSPHRERTRSRDAAPGLMVATRKRAARVNEALTGCGTGLAVMRFSASNTRLSWLIAAVYHASSARTRDSLCTLLPSKHMPRFHLLDQYPIGGTEQVLRELSLLLGQSEVDAVLLVPFVEPVLRAYFHGIDIVE